MEAAMSRKEKLALYKQQKLLKQTTNQSKDKEFSKVKPTNGSLKSKVQLAAKSSLYKSDIRRSAVVDNNVIKAGKKKIAPNTPIGKLQAKLRAKKDNNATTIPSNSTEIPANCAKNIFGSDNKPIGCSSEFNKIIEMKLDEAEYLYDKHGPHVARAYLEELPKDDECVHIELLSRAVYWLAWIKIEQKAHQWERVEELFKRAAALVRTNVDQKVIAAAYETFRLEADAILESKLDSLTKSNLVQSYVPRTSHTSPIGPSYDTDNTIEVLEPEHPDHSCSSKQSIFHNVNVANTKKIYEKGTVHTNNKNKTEAVDVGQVNVKNLTKKLQSSIESSRKMGQKLAGAVALPGIFVQSQNDSLNRRELTLPERMPEDALSSLLGISDDQENVERCLFNDASIELEVSKLEPDEKKVLNTIRPTLQRQCQTRAPIRILGKSGDIFSDSEDDKENDNDYNETDDKTTSECAEVVRGKRPISAVENTERKTRSGVRFSQECSTPREKTLDSKKKRKVTPFKPHIDDIILSE